MMTLEKKNNLQEETILVTSKSITVSIVPNLRSKSANQSTQD